MLKNEIKRKKVNHKKKKKRLVLTHQTRGLSHETKITLQK
jgi:hypothetical protein